ncbi:MAG: ATP-binding protein [Acidobacteria bacterium]|nr:ATP-binding protein [Acidobacteriota bacterium]
MDPVELSMIAIDRDRPAAREFDRLSEAVLTVAAIYGPNASGKSNLLEALAWLSDAVWRSLANWDEVIPREPFRFGKGPATSSTFDIELIVGGVRFEYSLEVDDSAVLFEGLYSYPERRRRVLFEREGDEIRFRRGLGVLAGTRELLTPTTLALSAATRLRDSEIGSAGRAIAGIRSLGASRMRRLARGPGIVAPFVSTTRLFNDSGAEGQTPLFEKKESGDNGEPTRGLDATRKSAMALLRLADFGVHDVRIVKHPIEHGADQSSPRRRHVQLIHSVEGQQLPFEMGEESAGTQAWFELIGPVLDALEHGQILLFDESDASLHPRLSGKLLELFRDPDTNPRGAQGPRGGC